MIIAIICKRKPPLERIQHVRSLHAAAACMLAPALHSTTSRAFIWCGSFGLPSAFPSNYHSQLAAAAPHLTMASCLHRYELPPRTGGLPPSLSEPQQSWQDSICQAAPQFHNNTGLRSGLVFAYQVKQQLRVFVSTGSLLLCLLHLIMQAPAVQCILKALTLHLHRTYY